LPTKLFFAALLCVGTAVVSLEVPERLRLSDENSNDGIVFLNERETSVGRCAPAAKLPRPGGLKELVVQASDAYSQIVLRKRAVDSFACAPSLLPLLFILRE
jgi:hypothetical protein